jgi:hypothetical protein
VVCPSAHQPDGGQLVSLWCFLFSSMISTISRVFAQGNPLSYSRSLNIIANDPRARRDSKVGISANPAPKINGHTTVKRRCPSTVRSFLTSAFYICSMPIRHLYRAPTADEARMANCLSIGRSYSLVSPNSFEVEGYASLVPKCVYGQLAMSRYDTLGVRCL